MNGCVSYTKSLVPKLGTRKACRPPPSPLALAAVESFYSKPAPLVARQHHFQRDLRRRPSLQRREDALVGACVVLAVDLNADAIARVGAHAGGGGRGVRGNGPDAGLQPSFSCIHVVDVHAPSLLRLSPQHRLLGGVRAFARRLV